VSRREDDEGEAEVSKREGEADKSRVDINMLTHLSIMRPIVSLSLSLHPQRRLADFLLPGQSRELRAGAIGPDCFQHDSIEKHEMHKHYCDGPKKKKKKKMVQMGRTEILQMKSQPEPQSWPAVR
jgi:hypothetical protein